jgi:hypothetical protein
MRKCVQQIILWTHCLTSSFFCPLSTFFIDFFIARSFTAVASAPKALTAPPKFTLILRPELLPLEKKLPNVVTFGSSAVAAVGKEPGREGGKEMGKANAVGKDREGGNSGKEREGGNMKRKGKREEKGET